MPALARLLVTSNESRPPLPISRFFPARLHTRIHPPTALACHPQQASLPEEEKREERKEKRRRRKEKKKDVQLTCGPHILYFIFFAD
jgi:hypothetical protein